MNLPKINVISYKHDGTLHRIWSDAYIIDKNDNMIVTITDETIVYENNNRKWVTNEPAVNFFYKDKWFNVIAMIKEKGVYYYVNIASPIVYDKEGIKYIDYDLDLKIYPTKYCKILDRYEFKHNIKKYQYNEDIINIVKNEIEEVKQILMKKELPFKEDVIYNYYDKYLKIKMNEKRN